ncbi:MAG: phosphoribosylformylglycinamidine cyclo-ligase [Campylobacterales bacterium]
MELSYKSAGVDIDAGNRLVEEIKPLVQSTFNNLVVGGIGGFAGAFRIPTGYKRPVLLGATDGVGTKLKIAIETGKLRGVGIDLVAMCLNDLICSFGTPLFFLDYYATGKLDVKQAKEVIAGIVEGCKIGECALIGGETAEMPGMYREGEFDIAGFAVGIAEEEELRPRVEEGDLLVALPSSGLHSNGFSLVRKLLFEKLNYSYDDTLLGGRVADLLLTPTRIYVREFKKLRPYLKGVAHITGGGILENLPRILPDNLRGVVYKQKLRPLPIFQFLAQYIPEEELFRTFNNGVGLILAVSPENLEEVLANSDGYLIGEVISGPKGVTLK